MFTLNVSGSTPAELLANLLLAVSSMQAGAHPAPADKETKKVVAENVEDSEELNALHKDLVSETKTTGRTTGRRNSKKTETTEEPEEKTSRRSRGKGDSLVNDNEEQAALRDALVKHLQDLADIEEAHGAVADALKRVGAKTVTEIASASLGDFNEDIQAVIAKFAKDTSTGPSDEDKDKETLKTDLGDLQDILDDKNDVDAADDVRDTLLDAWEAAGVKAEEDKSADVKLVRKLNDKTFKAFRVVVDSLIAKYF